MRNALLTAIYTYMQSNPDDPFVLGIGQNYGVREGYQSGPYPSAVAFIVSDNPDGDLGEDSREFEWQMSIYSQDQTEVETLAESCRGLFSGVKLVSGNCAFMNVFNGFYGPQRQDDTEPWMCAVTFDC